jgi:hypothetical protein
VEKDPSVHVKVADGHLVDVPSHGEVILNLTDTNGDPFTVRINNVIYVPVSYRDSSLSICIE